MITQGQLTALTKTFKTNEATILREYLQLIFLNALYSFPNSQNIVFKGGTGTNGRKLFKKKMKGDIDDGNMRSIALAVASKKTIKVYMGFPKPK